MGNEYKNANLFEAVESDAHKAIADSKHFEKERLSIQGVIGGLKSFGDSFLFANRDKIEQAINTASDDDFVGFLKFFVEYERRETLGVNIVESFLSRALAALEEGNPDVELYLFPAIFPYNDKSLDRGNSGKTSYFLHLVLKTFSALYGQYPKGSKKFLAGLVDGGDVISPTVLVSTFADLLWRPYLDDDARRLILHGINNWSSYWSTQRSKYWSGQPHGSPLPGDRWAETRSSLDNPFFQGLIKNLDFEKETNYSRTLNILTLVEKLGEWNYESGNRLGSIDNIEYLLKANLDTDRGSYFLHVRLKDVYFKLLRYKYGDGDDVNGLRNRYLKLFNYHSGDLGLLSRDPHLAASDKKEEGVRVDYLKDFSVLPERSFDIAPGERSLFKNGILYLPDRPDERGASTNVLAQPEVTSPVGGGMHRAIIDDFLPVAHAADLGAVDRNLADVRDYTFMITSESIHDTIENDFGITLSEISLPEQFHFLQFIKRKEAKEIKPVQNFVKEYHLAGLRTFLSLDYGKDLGDKIVELGNALDSKAASEIFSKYGQIIDAAHEVGAYLKENFGEHAAVDDQAVGKIVENLLSRGKDLLVHFSDELRAAKQKGSVLDSESVLRELSDIQTETLLFLSSFKTLRREGVDIDFQEVKDVEFYSVPGSALSEEDLRRMKDMYAKNYAHAPEIRDALLSGFDHSVMSPKTTFYVLRYKGEIISFVRFDEEGNGKLHAASLNVDPHFRGSAIGETVMEKTLDMKAKTRCSMPIALHLPMSGRIILKPDLSPSAITRSKESRVLI